MLQVWEDPSTLRRGARIKPGERVISVASGGDNVLSLLLDNPSLVVGVDYSPAQVHVCELKRLGIKHLDYWQFLCLIGIGEDHAGGLSRVDIYTKLLRKHLPEQVAKFWDEKMNFIENGLIHAGIYEQYFKTFAQVVRPFAHSRETIRSLLCIKDPDKQREFYDKHVDTFLWRVLCRLYFGDVLIGRCPPFYEKADVNVGEHFLQRLRHVMRDVPACDNHYLEYVLLGDITGEFGLPEYLQPQNFELLKSRVDSLYLTQGDLVDYLAEHKEEFNVIDLSNIFDFVPDNVHQTYRNTVSKYARLGSRVINWTFVPVSDAKLDFTPFSPGMHVERPLSVYLNSLERAWFYQTFVIQMVMYKDGQVYTNGSSLNGISNVHKNGFTNGQLNGCSCEYLNGNSNGYHDYKVGANNNANGHTKPVTDGNGHLYTNGNLNAVN